MPEPIISPTAVIEPPVTPPATPPPATTLATPPPAAPPVTPPVEPPVTPPATPPPVTPPASIATTYELKGPEGNLLTKDYVAQFQKDAIAAGLSKDEAQDLLDTQIRAVKDFQDRSNISIEQEKVKWKEATRADPEIGGDKLNKTSELSRRVVERFGNEAFRKLLNDTGFGNYPEVLRFLSKVGAAFSEDQLRPGSPSSGGVQKSKEEILFGATTPA